MLVVYNGLKTLSVIPDNFDSLTKNETKAKIKRISDLYVVDSEDLFEVFY